MSESRPTRRRSFTRNWRRRRRRSTPSPTEHRARRPVRSRASSRRREHCSHYHPHAHRVHARWHHRRMRSQGFRQRHRRRPLARHVAAKLFQDHHDHGHGHGEDRDRVCQRRGRRRGLSRLWVHVLMARACQCPSCADNHVDLSLGFWDALGSSRGQGVSASSSAGLLPSRTRSSRSPLVPIKFHIE